MLKNNSRKNGQIDLTGLTKEQSIILLSHLVFEFWQRERVNYKSNKEMLPYIIDEFVSHKISNAGERYSNSNDFAMVPPILDPSLLTSYAILPILVAYGYTLEPGDTKKVIELCRFEIEKLNSEV